MSTELIVALIALAGSVLAPIISGILNRRKNEADSWQSALNGLGGAASFLDAQTKAAKELMERLDKAEAKIDALEKNKALAIKKIAALERHVRELEQLLKKSGVDIPVFHWTDN